MKVTSLFCLVLALVLVELAAGAKKKLGGRVNEAKGMLNRPLNEREVNLNSGYIHDMFEGDILLTQRQKALIRATDYASKHSVHERAVVIGAAMKWPNAQVPYELHSSLRSAQRNSIERAIQEYHTQTCVRFRPRNGERNYISFVRGTGCYSYVGVVGGAQRVSIGSGCEDMGTVLHEMFHALGRWHEQSRPDRDQYIRVKYNNIRNGLSDQFDKVSTTMATTNGVGYDYFSIMHYDAYAFSRNKQPTIVPLDSSISLDDLGQRMTFSSKDLQHINVLYCGGGSPSSQWSSWSAWSQCSTTCGQGTQRRSRSCIGEDKNICRGNEIEMRSCNSGRCRMDTGMSDWSEWSSPCTSKCLGFRWRRRHCINPSIGCSSPYFQFAVCGDCRSEPRVNKEAGSQLRVNREAGSQLRVNREAGSQPRVNEAVALLSKTEGSQSRVNRETHLQLGDYWKKRGLQQSGSNGFIYDIISMHALIFTCTSSMLALNFQH